MQIRFQTYTELFENHKFSVIRSSIRATNARYHTQYPYYEFDLGKFKVIETRARSHWLVGLFKPANQSAEHAVVSITLNVNRTHTKGSEVA